MSIKYKNRSSVLLNKGLRRGYEENCSRKLEIGIIFVEELLIVQTKIES